MLVLHIYWRDITESGQYNGHAFVKNKECGFCVGLEGFAAVWQVQKL